MIAGPSEQIAGRHVLVVDGVLDAGRTVAKAVSLIRAAGAASVQVAVMLDKQRPTPWPRPILSASAWAMILSWAMAWTMRGGYRGLPYIGKVPGIDQSCHSRPSEAQAARGEGTPRL